jgi:iron-sulfur cluster assembly protein
LAGFKEGIMMIKRERPPIITLTENAAQKVHKIMQKSNNDIIGIHLSLKNAGCAGMAYVMDYAKEHNPIDEVVEHKGIKIFIDPKALMFLIGLEMDFKQDKLKEGFVFNNPNQKDACGCGESVKLVAAEKIEHPNL